MKSLRMLAALLLGTVVALAGCTSSDTGDTKFHFNGATPLGTLIPPDDRKPAEHFTGSLLDGGTYRLTQDAGRITVVNFWGSWCGPCQTETPQFGLVYDKYKKQHVAFVGIDVLEAGRDEPKAFVAHNGVHYPNVYDEDGKTALVLGNIRTQGYPFTVLLDKQHRVAAVYLLRLSAKDLEPMLNKLIAEKS